jgi:hypothetical protein
MSTKLYNGIKFKSNNIKEVLDQLISVKETAKQIAIDSISDRDLSLFINANKLLDSDAWVIANELKEAIASDNYNRWSFKPRLKFSVIVYPTTEGDIYGYYFDCDKKEYNDLIKPFYTDFHYQNQTDPPNDVSEKDWDFRRDKWDELLKDRFMDTGFSYEIVSGDDLDFFDLVDKIKIVLDKLKREEKINQVIDK